MRIERRHEWDLDVDGAMRLQERLRGEVDVATPLPLDDIGLIAGSDVVIKDDEAHAVVVVATFPALQPVETVHGRARVRLPNTPAMTSFREGPALLDAFGKLANEPDVFLFDGAGIAHPQRFGTACHLGLFLERPTIGCGKTRLCGRFSLLPEDKGAMAPLTDDGETIGMAVRTRTRMNPMFISPGHRADLESAVALVMRTTEKYRLPEPIRLAHKAGQDQAAR
ncbi:MAG: endonuclease V [Salinarimonas sp.]